MCQPYIALSDTEQRLQWFYHLFDMLKVFSSGVLFIKYGTPLSLFVGWSCVCQPYIEGTTTLSDMEEKLRRFYRLFYTPALFSSGVPFIKYGTPLTIFEAVELACYSDKTGTFL